MRLLTIEEVLQGVLNANQDALKVENAGVAASASTKVTYVRGLKAPAAIATPEALAAVGTYVSTVTIWALRAGRAANVGSVFVDVVSTNDAQLVELVPGGSVTFTAPPGRVIDLADIFVDSATLTDGVFFLGML